MVPSLVYSKRAIFEDLGYTPHAGQVEIHRSTAPRRIVACGVRSGKTKCAAMEGVVGALMPNEHSVGWIVAPTYDLCDRVFREIQVVVLEKLHHRLELMRESDRRIVIRNLGGGISEIKAKSADNPISLLGEGLDWCIVDEASRLKPVIWQSHLSQRLIDKKGWALLISTPRGRGYFYDLFRRGQEPGRDPDYQSWNFPSWTNPMLDASLIEDERKRLPERVFLQEFGAQFVEGSGAVFHGVRDCATGEWKDPQPHRTYFIGLDLAKTTDYTVMVVMSNEREVVCVDRFQRIDWTLQIARIQALAYRYCNARVLCDVSGVGSPIYDALHRAGCIVTPYRFTASSKAELIENLLMMIEQRQIVLPRPELWPDGIDELESYQYAESQSGNLRMNAPSGQHDDCVIALGLAAWQIRRGTDRPHISVIGRRRRDRRAGRGRWVPITGYQPPW